MLSAVPRSQDDDMLQVTVKALCSLLFPESDGLSTLWRWVVIRSTSFQVPVWTPADESSAGQRCAVANLGGTTRPRLAPAPRQPRDGRREMKRRRVGSGRQLD